MAKRSAKRAKSKRRTTATSNGEKPAKTQPAKAREKTSALSGLHEWRGHSNKIAWEAHQGDVSTVLKTFDENRFACVVTSPPYYWQRDYNVEGQIGHEPTIDGYVNAIADSMEDVQRVLRKDGCLFLNLGDTYYSAKGQPHGRDPKTRARRFGLLRAVDGSHLGVPRKTIIGIPWRVALEMIDRGWILRSPIIWKREGSIPEPTAKDRPWRTYETVFLFSKSPKYKFYRDALDKEEDVWTISDRPQNNNGLHAAAFPDKLVEKCLSVGCPPDGEVLDPFVGTGTVMRVAVRSGRPAVGVDLNRDFCEYTAKMLDNL